MGLFDRFKKKDVDAAPTAEVRALIAQLESGGVRDKVMACHSLARIGPPAQSAVPALMDLLHDDDGDLCNAAAAAMSSIERQRA